MEFFLTMRKVVSVLTTDKPTPLDKPTDADPNQLEAWTENQKQLQAWTEQDYLCKNFILNGLSDDLYDYYNSNKTAKNIWDALQKKYDTEEAGAKKYAVSRYLKYQMTDDRSVEMQSHELQKIAHEIISEGMTLDEQFQIAVIIDKLPPGWKDFKNVLRHKTKEFSLESLITRLRIEEEARKQDQKEEVLVVNNNNTKKAKHAILKPNPKPLRIRTATNRIGTRKGTKEDSRNQPKRVTLDSCFCVTTVENQVIWHASVETSLALLRRLT